MYAENQDVLQKKFEKKQKERMERLKDIIPEEVYKNINEKLEKELDYIPKIAIIGKTGVGKSPFCNALFGRKIRETSAYKGCTRKIESFTYQPKNGTLNYTIKCTSWK